MSIKILTSVWKYSQHAGGELLVLAAIADYANDEGRAYPAVATLAAKCRMKPRNCQYILRSLERSGELSILANEGPKGVNVYRINLNSMGMQISGPEDATDCADRVQPNASKPSVNLQEPSTESQARSPRGARLAADWSLLPGWMHWALKEKPEWDEKKVLSVAEHFSDYWHAKSGKDAIKNDWFATWRNWVRNERGGEVRKKPEFKQEEQDYARGVNKDGRF